MYIEKVSSRLSDHQPSLLNLENNRHGAVAMILRPGESGDEVLFIERTRVETDPWSGQMAFPGGTVETRDTDARKAAERETLEEVGIDLNSATFMGRLDDVQGRHRAHLAGIVVSGFVFFDEHRQETIPNEEVADVVWTPLAKLADPGRISYVDYAPGERFPGIRVGRAEHQVVWGLTRRFLISFFEIIGQPFPVEPEESLGKVR
ncbi:MAG: CoA pyrophosphatase [Arenicellales bacterium]